MCNNDIQAWGITSFFLILHRWLCTPQSSVPGVLGAWSVRSPHYCVRLGESSIVQQVGHQSESVPVWWKRRLHHSGRRGSRWPGNGSHHLHPHLHHHTAQWVGAELTQAFRVWEVKVACDWFRFASLSKTAQFMAQSLNIHQAVIHQHGHQFAL